MKTIIEMNCFLWLILEREEWSQTWSAFIALAASRDAAGEAIYSAIFEAAPSLQSLFKTPRAVMAMGLVALCSLHSLYHLL